MLGYRSQITVKIFGYYFLNPSKAHYINELADMLNVDVGNLFRKLKELEKEGILVAEQQGNQRYFKLNKNYPLLKELKKTYEIKYGLTRRLSEKIKDLKKLKEAYIFGSYAQNKLQQESDIDILLIGDHSTIEAKRLILPLQKIIKREINIIDLSLKELESRKKNKDAFISTLFSQKIIKIH
ncbi:hypothetical protein COT40_01790 [Candidatus Peregrinibacteria bacterium CG08_land_8_20_14_0_20_41_10]|nr:MAG: hypothetical protein COT40_01790 [Candidatus Peregrinibacteria bacterium CG08_land_8_20_14_0_20_41_10]